MLEAGVVAGRTSVTLLGCSRRSEGHLRGDGLSEKNSPERGEGQPVWVAFGYAAQQRISELESVLKDLAALRRAGPQLSERSIAEWAASYGKAWEKAEQLVGVEK